MKQVFLLLQLIVLTALPQAQAAEAPFSTNDLSILFPIETTQNNVPKYKVQPGSQTWGVLSTDNFKAILSAARSEHVHLTSKLKDPKSWYLVGLRYAPCTLFAGATPACKEQIRFIFQALGAERGEGNYDDYAIHVVFNFADLQSPQLSPRLESFRAIKNRFSAQTLDQPLAVHPVLNSQEGLAYFQMLETEVLQKHINVRRPSLITFMGLGHGGSQSDHWVFLTGNIDSRGKWNLAPLNVGPPLKSEHMKISQDDEFKLVSNVRVKPGEINLFAPGLPINSDLPMKALDPHQTNDHNVACASCHVADASVFPVLFDRDDEPSKVRFMGQMMNVFANKSRLTELLIDNSIHTGKMGFEVPAVRIFGYLDNRVLVSQRVVLDSATAVEQANSLLGLSTKKQCDSDAQRKAVVACVYLGEPSATLEDCLRSACR